MGADRHRLELGAVVLAHLVAPAEKYVGVLVELEPVGVTLRGISLTSLDGWMRELAAGGTVTLGPATMFFPLHRVERLFLDERVGVVESYGHRFERTVGSALAHSLG